jgi:hypothetical protein
MLNLRASLCALVLLVPAAAQNITSLSPSSVAFGSPTFTLTVNGSGFLGTNVVQWDGATQPTNFISSTQLTATISSSLVSAIGSHNIRVKFSIAISIFSNTVAFSVVNPAPVLNSINPTSVTTGASGVVLICNGTGFIPTSVIRWNGSPITTAFASSSLVSAIIPTALIPSSASASITVQNPAPGGGTTPPQTLAIVNPVPTLTGLSPNNVVGGGTGFNLQVNGTGFNSASLIRLNGVSIPTTLVTTTQLSGVISATQSAAAVVHDVTVFNPAPAGGTSNVLQLTIVNPGPSINVLIPQSVSGGGPAQTILINGSNFIPTSALAAAGFQLPVTFNSPTQLSVVIPPNLLESTTLLPILVVNGPPGGGSVTTHLSVTGPAIASTSPAFLPVLSPASPAVVLTVTGAGFASGDIVRINGVPRPTTFVSGTSLSCTVDGTVPATLQAGGFALTVNRPGLVSNAIGVRVGTASFPNNEGTVTVGPVPPAPGQLFDIRVEVPITTVLIPIPSVSLTLVADTAAPSPFVISPAGMNFVVGPGLGSPLILCDGLGIFGPAAPVFGSTHFEDLATFGVPVLRGVFRSPAIVAPPPLGLTISFLAVYQNVTVPAGIGITHISGPYTF